MPKVAYSEEERRQIRDDLIRASLELMAEQGIQHTTDAPVSASSLIRWIFA